jgi:hypothetical protein
MPTLLERRKTRAYTTRRLSISALPWKEESRGSFRTGESAIQIARSLLGVQSDGRWRRISQGEVITVLEGLTSNFFAVYPGGVLRTANTGVLCGYARKRILQAAESIGYRVEEAPIGLQEASLWKEVFLTSSIRICQPVQKIVYADSKEVFWEEDPVERDGSQAMWRQLYQHVIIAASL